MKSRLAPVVASLPLLTACGAGTAGVVAGSDSGGGSGAPALTTFAVIDPKVSPTSIAIESSAAVEVQLFVDVPVNGEEPLEALSGPGVTGNRVTLGRGMNLLTWRFGDQLGTSLTENVTLRARRGAATIEGGELALAGIGNDAPEVSNPVTPDDEVSGVVPLGIRISDSSSDVISVDVEWKFTDEPDTAWRRAAPAGAFPDEDQLQGVEAPAAGADRSFFWDTTAADGLPGGVGEVHVRFTPDDGTRDADGGEIGVGDPVISEAFEVDNNAEPIVQLQTELVIANPDERRGIPIPFKVFDEEGDVVEVILQWRREGEQFPPLPTDMDELDAILADRDLRREHQICTPYPRYAQGRAIPVDDTHIRLPELASTESWIVPTLAGRTLELLRPSNIPEPLSPTWDSNPLIAPVAALPLGDGLTALVLDATVARLPAGLGSWRLIELELATGVVLREFATGAGAPSTMTLERGEKSVLLASDIQGLWRVMRVELGGGFVTELARSDGSSNGPVRGIASLGKHAAAFTADSALLFLDERLQEQQRVSTLLGGLATPWGVVVDPLRPRTLYVSERDEDRILSVHLDERVSVPVAITDTMQPPGLERPTALALEKGGTRLLTLAEGLSGARLLVGIELGVQEAGVDIIGPAGTQGGASLSTGRDGLRIVALAGDEQLMIGGGVEQRIPIGPAGAFDPETQHVTLAETPRVPIRESQTWRIGGVELAASKGGSTASFVWNALADLTAGGRALLRGTARDDELGIPFAGAGVKRVESSFESEPISLGPWPDVQGSRASTHVIADVDGDGDLDIVTANTVSNNLALLHQTSPGDFEVFPEILGPFPGMNGPAALVATDLEGDGDTDLVCASATGHLTILHRQGGVFVDTSAQLGPTSPFVRNLVAADLDGDGDPDLASANGASLSLLFQGSRGFDSPPRTLEPPDGFGASWVVAADLDGNGRVDLASTANGARALIVYMQNEVGDFEARIAETPPSLGFATRITTVDADGDGDLDLIVNTGLFPVSPAFGPGLVMFLQEAPGVFSEARVVIGPSYAVAVDLVTAVDLQGDGIPDLATVLGDDVVMFEGGPLGFVGEPIPLFPRPTGFGSVAWITATDLNADSLPDIAMANVPSSPPTTATVSLFIQEQKGAFRRQPTTISEGLAIPASVRPADIDGDGSLELVTANAGNDTLLIFDQSAPGVFDVAPAVIGPLPQLIEPQDLTVADLDRDGDLDIASANLGGTLTVFYGENGSFTPEVIGPHAFLGNPRRIRAGDLDGDGALELVSVANVLAICRRNSTGTFEEHFSFGITVSAFDVLLEDIEGDGDLDLATASLFPDSRLTVIRQSGSGFEIEPIFWGGFDGPSSIVASDMDRDGDLDLAMSDLFGDFIAVFPQRAGIFSAPPTLIPSDGVVGPYSLVAADLNGDGAIDLASANRDGNNLAVFRQSRLGFFTAAPQILTTPSDTSEPVSIKAVDLDGDGDVDLVSANSASDTLTIFWGGR